MPRSNALAKKASRRTRLQQIRRLAPKHPPAPEARIRLAITKLLRAYHKHIIETLLAYAPIYQAKHGRVTLSAKDDPIISTVTTGLKNQGKQLLNSSQLKKRLDDEAQKTAESARRQVAEALGMEASELPYEIEEQIEALANGIYDKVDSFMGESIERAEDILDDWTDLSLDTLEDELDGGLDGILGSALGSAALIFGFAWGDMNKNLQEDAGVEKYMWVTAGDAKVRPSHRALDGEIASWDDPPLKSEDSDIEEDCDPGQDYGCRCVASPIGEESGSDQDEG